MLKYDGQVYDVKFLQDEVYNINVMISIHNSPNQIIITSLNDFHAIDTLPLEFGARSINIHPNHKQIYIIAVTRDEKYKGKWLCFDLGFEKKHLNKRKHDMRNQNLKSIHDGNLKKFADIMKPDYKMGAFDILHCMNLFHLCAINANFSEFHELRWQNVQYLKDSNLKAPADYILENNNMKGMKYLFDIVLGIELHGKKIDMDLDKSLLFHGLMKYPGWLEERAEEDMM